MSKLSDRLLEAKEALGLSASQMEKLAEEGGYKLSNFNAKVYTNGSHGEPTLPTLEALAYVLRIPLAEVLDLAGLNEPEPFTPHRSADMLTAPQRAAVNEIIRLMAEGNRRAGDEGADSTPAIGADDKELARLYPVPDVEDAAASTDVAEMQARERDWAERGEESQVQDDD